jgi:hypothetical protein
MWIYFYVLLYYPYYQRFRYNIFQVCKNILFFVILFNYIISLIIKNKYIYIKYIIIIITYTYIVCYELRPIIKYEKKMLMYI